MLGRCSLRELKCVEVGGTMKIKWLRKCEEKSSAPQISLTDKIERCERNLFALRNNFRALALMFAALIAIQLRSLFIGFAARLLNLGNSKCLSPAPTCTILNKLPPTPLRMCCYIGLARFHSLRFPCFVRWKTFQHHDHPEPSESIFL